MEKVHLRVGDLSYCTFGVYGPYGRQPVECIRLSIGDHIDMSLMVTKEDTGYQVAYEDAYQDFVVLESGLSEDEVVNFILAHKGQEEF